LSDFLVEFSEIEKKNFSRKRQNHPPLMSKEKNFFSAYSKKKNLLNTQKTEKILKVFSLFFFIISCFISDDFRQSIVHDKNP